MVSASANEIATADKKSTIMPEHVLRALQVTGFGSYVDDVKLAWEQHKEENKSEHAAWVKYAFLIAVMWTT